MKIVAKIANTDTMNTNLCGPEKIACGIQRDALVVRKKKIATAIIMTVSVCRTNAGFVTDCIMS